MTQEQPGAVTFQGSPMTLVGTKRKSGDTLPDLPLVNSKLESASPLAADMAKAHLLITVPLLDTSVCSLETKKFSDRMKEIKSDDVAVCVISADLPFAQSRWCGAEDVDNLTLLSTYRAPEFGAQWGVLVKELGLLARAVFVTDGDGTILYEQVVPEIADEPDYDAAFAALRQQAAS